MHSCGSSLLFPRVLMMLVAGPEKAKNSAERRVLHLIQNRLATPSLTKIMPLGQHNSLELRLLLTVQNSSRSGLIQFALCADSFQAVNKRVDLLLLARNDGVLFLNMPMFFQKLIQQHRVHLVVA